MNQILWNIGSFILALGILVTIHEYGHYWVARKLGVKVLRFSVGFGKALWSRKAANGTEYAVAAIPLGGYVKMLDEREGKVDPDERHLAFNNQPVLSRIAIVAAGPLANFLLAILVYIWMYWLGVPALKPIIAKPALSSIAQQAGLTEGDLILAVDGKAVGSWQDVNHAIARRMGEKESLVLRVQHQDESLQRDYGLSLANWQLDPQNPDLLGSLGLAPWTPNLPSVLGEIQPEMAAAKAGLLEGDKVVSIDGQSINSWTQLVTMITENPDRTLEFELLRNGETLRFDVRLGAREQGDRRQGYLGVSQPQWSEHAIQRIEQMRHRQEYGFLEAIPMGLEKTWDITLLSFRLIGKLFTGEVSPKNLSGPISIAQGAGAYASFGFVFFLSFLGMISVNLGIINILPIPVLDGGHLMYYLIELVRGKPLPESVQEIGLRVGLVMVLSLMVFSIFNDISRL